MSRHVAAEPPPLPIDPSAERARTRMIEEITSSVAAGTYAVSAGAIADALLREAPLFRRCVPSAGPTR